MAEDILAKDGAIVLALQINTKYELLDMIVAGNLQSVAKFHRLYDQSNKTGDFQVETLFKARKFLNNNCKKLHLLIMFEEYQDYKEEELVIKKRKANSPRTKSLSPPRRSSRMSLDYKRITTTGTLKGSTSSLKNLSSMSEVEFAMDDDPKLVSPNVKQETTPRSSMVSSSAIPRNAPKRSAIAI